MPMMNTNKKASVQRAVNQRAAIQHAIIQHAVNQHAVNQRALKQRMINQRILNQQVPLAKTENQIDCLCVKNVKKTVYVPVDIPKNDSKIVLNKI